MCDNCEWADLLEQIEDMLSDDRYSFASDTLEGIYDWVTEQQHCTESQVNAVNNIAGAN